MRTCPAFIASLAVLCAACANSTYGVPSSPGVAIPRSTGIPTPAGNPRSTAAPAAVTVSVALTAEQAALVRDHYRSSGPGRGRGRGGGLPPGIARNLQRGKPLPPGIAKQYLPSGLLSALPPVGDGLDYVIAGGKLLLVEAATQIIRNVLIEAVFD